MSATLTLRQGSGQVYEPFRLPAGILAIAVHSAFFALLYFGFSWQTYPPAMRSIEVDMWQSLPAEVATPPAKPVEEAKVEPVQAPEKQLAPDIVLPDKKKVETKLEAPKPIKKIEPKPVVEKKAETKAVEEKSAVSSAQQQAALEQAEKAAVIGRIVDEYKAKIMAKIRSNIVMPPNVVKDARAEFAVTLLPGGSVLPPRLTRSSGNTAYDNAVERAILKSDPFPLPPDVTIFNRFRELNLVFKPVE